MSYSQFLPETLALNHQYHLHEYAPSVTGLPDLIRQYKTEAVAVKSTAASESPELEPSRYPEILH